MLKVEFETVQDYLRDLELISRTIGSNGYPSITYLAAAVSDFYIPTEKMSEHKIDSAAFVKPGEPALKLELYPVPKMLGEVKKVWN